MTKILSWKELENFKINDLDRINGVTNSYSNLRLFNFSPNKVELTLYRDRHAWCPYCQKIWLWLEFKRIPYKVKKINMFCYGKKENWYLEKVNSGILPAIEFKGQVISESDQIISFLEKEFGVLGSAIFSFKLEKIRKIEREIFRAWCDWLCRENIIFMARKLKETSLRKALEKLEDILNTSSTGFIDPIEDNRNEIKPGTGDIIFIPYIERLNASLCYYKGFCLRKEFPLINKWLTLLENQSEYRGTQGDFHTHSHDLPPQMGGCYIEKNNNQIYFSSLIDNGEGLGELELNTSNNNSYYTKVALTRVIKHKENIINSNPCKNDLFEFALKSVLTFMSTKEIIQVDNDSAVGLRYLRDRISVPRDMPVLSARILRQSIEKIASFCESNDIFKIPTQHRYDQNPFDFLTSTKD